MAAAEAAAIQCVGADDYRATDTLTIFCQDSRRTACGRWRHMYASGSLDPECVMYSCAMSFEKEHMSDLPATVSQDRLTDAPAAPLTREDLVPFVVQGIAEGIATGAAHETKTTESAAKVAPGFGRSDKVELEKAKIQSSVRWPDKKDLLGVEVSTTDYDSLAHVRSGSASQRTRADYLPPGSWHCYRITGSGVSLPHQCV